MNTLCVVGSGKKKVWHTLPDCGLQKARNVYIGAFTRKCVDYAVSFYPLSWCILSPKYGFFMPDDLVYAPGCAKFDRLETSPLPIEALALQARSLELDQYSTILTLASKAHLDVLRGIFPRAKIESPLLSKGGIGKQMSALSRAIKAQTPLA